MLGWRWIRLNAFRVFKNLRTNRKKKFKHILLNNNCHESVGQITRI